MFTDNGYSSSLSVRIEQNAMRFTQFGYKFESRTGAIDLPCLRHGFDSQLNMTMCN
jgi:hypothetical protein